MPADVSCHSTFRSIPWVGSWRNDQGGSGSLGRREWRTGLRSASYSRQNQATNRIFLHWHIWVGMREETRSMGGGVRAHSRCRREAWKRAMSARCKLDASYGGCFCRLCCFF